MKKYIIYLGIFFLPDKNSAAQRAMAISYAVSEKGYIPIIIGVDDKLLTSDKILDTKTKFKYGYYYTMKYPENTVSWLRFITNINDVIRIINHIGNENIQAVIAMDYYSIALKKLINFCKKKKIRFVIDTVDWFMRPKDEFLRGIVKEIDTSYRMKIVNKKSDNMIVISKYLHRYYKFYVKNIVEIPGIVSNDLICPNDNRKERKEEDIYTIGFVGDPGIKCEKEKIDWLIKEICKINKEHVKIKFYIAGIDREKLFLNNQEISQIENFDDCVYCYGRISHDECIELIRNCDFSAIIRENNKLSKAGFPTKLAESYACGTPVLATPTSNIVDYIPKTHGIVASTCTQEGVLKMLHEMMKLDRSSIEDMHNTIRENNPLLCKNFIDQLGEVIENRGEELNENRNN